jgi:DNA-binding response OmpR family regulator
MVEKINPEKMARMTDSALNALGVWVEIVRDMGQQPQDVFAKHFRMLGYSIIDGTPKDYQFRSRYGLLTYSTDTREVVSPFLKNRDKSAILSPTEGLALELLMNRPRKIVTPADIREVISQHKKNRSHPTTEDAARQLIMRLRDKINDKNIDQDSSGTTYRLIHTIRSNGYVLSDKILTA